MSSLRRFRQPGQPGQPVSAAIRVVLSICYAVPLLWIVLTSFKRREDALNAEAALWFHPSTEAYEEAFSPALVTALGQSVVIATASTALVLLVAVPAAYALAVPGHHVGASRLTGGRPPSAL